MVQRYRFIEILFASFLIVCFSLSADASKLLGQKVSKEKRNHFEAIVEKISKFQATNPGQRPSPDEFVFISTVMGSFPLKHQSLIHRSVQDQINIWGDTILEGDYALVGEDYTVDSIENIIDQSSAVVAIKIQFSQTAVDTSTCELNIYDYPDHISDEKRFESCRWGKIYDQIYISPDFTIYERDTVQIEHFE